MALEALTQYVSKETYKYNKITVGGQEFKIAPNIKIFINGKAVEVNDVQRKLNKFSNKDIDMLKTQLSSIQEYSDVYGGSRKAIEEQDFQHADRNKAKDAGIKYTYIGEDENTAKFGCANGKFELYW